MALYFRYLDTGDYPMKKAIFFALFVLAAPLLLFRETSAQNKSNVAVLQYYSDPTGIACVSSSPLIGYASSIYSCQSSVYALYTISGGTTPTGPAGGDLGGTYPNPTALKTNGVSFGTAATVNTGTSGATIPLFNGTNTWAGVQTYTSDIVATGIKSQGGGTNGADIELPSTGAVLSRNTADANPALVVQNTNTSNTGNVVNFKFGATTVASLANTGNFTATLFSTTTNCANGASPAVCAAAPDGAVAIPTGTNPTLVVNTTAVTANSRITLTVDDSLTIASTTCNSTLATLAGGMAITARTAGTSFTIAYNGTIATNPVCVSYKIEN